MSDCKCKSPCNPCNKNCPDDEITEIRDIIKTSAPLEVELLDADECSGPCGGCCSSKCRDNYGINIQSTNDCLTVDTSECGVVKLTAECPKPTYVKAGDNVTVTEEFPPSDCYMDGGDCGIKGGWKVSASDEKVKACSGDSTPGYLYNKLQEGEGILIDQVGCDGTDSKIKISIDEDILPECPKPPDLIIDNQSTVINVSQSGPYEHRVLITDKDTPYYYAKLVLAEGHDWIENTLSPDTIGRFPLWSGHAVWETVYNKNLTISSGRIKITKSGLYSVGFSGSAECGSGVHAFRVQLYSTAEEVSSGTHTLIESRYSAPIGDQPFEVNGFPQQDFDIDNPLWGPATDIEWTQREANGKSASLGSYVSRMPVGGSTIVELKKGDYVCVGVKISSEVRYTGDILGEMDDYNPHFALLCKNSHRSGLKDTGPECGLSFYANLIHPTRD